MLHNDAEKGKHWQICPAETVPTQKMFDLGKDGPRLRLAIFLNFHVLCWRHVLVKVAAPMFLRDPIIRACVTRNEMLFIVPK